MDINIDLIFKVLMLIVIIGISVKAIKFITSVVFKIALVLFIILLVYKMFI
ncbi:MAG: hypothetical protein ACRC3Y_13495 [Romboutsia sp.]|uniref:hypothetical protein n=1 Tax=Romboutsia sp. TaxID=1965302 RepID=UPI003F3B4A61